MSRSKAAFNQPRAGCFVRFGTQYCKPAQCTSEYVFGELVGQGTVGSVFCASSKTGPPSSLDQCPYVVKVVPLDTFVSDELCKPRDRRTHSDCVTFTADEFKNEVEISKTMGDLEIGPKVHADWTCDNDYNGSKLGFIVTDRWDMTLEEYIERYNREARRNGEKLYDMLRSKIDMLLKHKELMVTHQDLHEGNIMVRLDKSMNPVDVALIDFVPPKSGGSAVSEGEEKDLRQELACIFFNNALLSGDNRVAAKRTCYPKF